MNPLVQELTMAMIPDGICKAIAEEIGIENMIKLADLVGGASFYMPQSESLLRPARDVKIRDEFNGYNTLELVRKYGVSERWVRRICGTGVIVGQQSFF